MAGYQFNVGQFIYRDIPDREVCTDKVILAFPCLVTQIFFDKGMLELLHVDQYIKPKNTTDLGLIWDPINPITRQAK